VQQKNNQQQRPDEADEKTHHALLRPAAVMDPTFQNGHQHEDRRNSAISPGQNMKHGIPPDRDDTIHPEYIKPGWI
jgi:hypothetical protein